MTLSKDTAAQKKRFKRKPNCEHARFQSSFFRIHDLDLRTAEHVDLCVIRLSCAHLNVDGMPLCFCR